MSINSDYAQYREYGLTSGKLEFRRGEAHSDEIGWIVSDSDKPKVEEPIIDDVKKKHVILPGWLNKKRGKAKL